MVVYYLDAAENRSKHLELAVPKGTPAEMLAFSFALLLSAQKAILSIPLRFELWFSASPDSDHFSG